MPIVTVYAETPSDSADIRALTAAVQSSGAIALNCEPSNVWVVFQAIPEGNYLQDRDKKSAPYVVIRAQKGRSDVVREGFVRAVADAVAHATSTSPRSVWIHYQELNPGDVWFDGHWAG